MSSHVWTQKNTADTVRMCSPLLTHEITAGKKIADTNRNTSQHKQSQIFCKGLIKYSTTTTKGWGGGGGGGGVG